MIALKALAPWERWVSQGRSGARNTGAARLGVLVYSLSHKIAIVKHDALHHRKFLRM